jgi:hypothetical protein
MGVNEGVCRVNAALVSIHDCQMVYFHTKKKTIWVILEGLGMENVCFMTI